MVVKTANKDQITFVLSPNRSATWQESRLLIIAMSSLVFIIAIAWTFVGAWFVLPFAGLELGLFAFLMYTVSKRSYQREVISLSKDFLILEKGHRKIQSSIKIKRDSLHVAFWQTERDWRLPQIILKTEDEAFLIGEFLNLDDRVLLKQELEDAGLIILRNRWWQRS